jgi:hypothetical protein
MSKAIVEIDGIKYQRCDTILKGNRAIVVIDRGWIYAGDVEEKNDRIILSNVVWLFNWKSIGFNKVIENPYSDKVDLRRIDNTIDVPMRSEIYRVPVNDDWGLKND